MSPTRSRRRRGLLHWLALFAAVLQPTAIAPVLLAAESGCGSECCCVVADDDPAPAERGCCASSDAAREAPAPERAEDECSCMLQRDGGAPPPERAAPPERSDRGDERAALEHGALVSAHTERSPALAPMEPSAHAPPDRSDGAPADGAPGPWKQLAQRGLDALLAGLGRALL